MKLTLSSGEQKRKKECVHQIKRYIDTKISNFDPFDSGNNLGVWNRNSILHGSHGIFNDFFFRKRKEKREKRAKTIKVKTKCMNLWYEIVYFFIWFKCRRSNQFELIEDIKRREETKL